MLQEVRSTLDEDSQSDLLDSVSQTLLAQWPKVNIVNNNQCNQYSYVEHLINYIVLFKVIY